MKKVGKVLGVLAKVSSLFLKHYPYVYNIIIAHFQEKPVEPLLEIEKAFAHLMQSISDFENGNNERAERNLDRFTGHIERMLLDMYKIAFLLLIKKTKDFESCCEASKVSLLIEELYKDARNFEIENLGSAIDDSAPVKEQVLDKYMENLKKAENEISRLADGGRG